MKSDVLDESVFLLLGIEAFDWTVRLFLPALVGVLNYEVDEGFFVVESFNCFIKEMFLGKY